MSTLNAINRAREFFERTVHPWWQRIVCSWPVELRKHSIELLLAGIFLQLDRLNENSGQGVTYFKLTPFQLVANEAPTQILDVEVQGRVREVSIWMDSACSTPSGIEANATACSVCPATSPLYTTSFQAPTRMSQEPAPVTRWRAATACSSAGSAIQAPYSVEKERNPPNSLANSPAPGSATAAATRCLLAPAATYRIVTGAGGSGQAVREFMALTRSTQASHIPITNNESSAVKMRLSSQRSFSRSRSSRHTRNTEYCSRSP